MAVILAVREAESWTLPNILGGLVLLAVALVALGWAIRRYLRD